MTEWFRRKSDKIKTFDKRDTEQGQWQKCPDCGEVLYYKILGIILYARTNNYE